MNDAFEWYTIRIHFGVYTHYTHHTISLLGYLYRAGYIELVRFTVWYVY